MFHHYIGHIAKHRQDRPHGETITRVSAPDKDCQIYDVPKHFLTVWKEIYIKKFKRSVWLILK